MKSCHTPGDRKPSQKARLFNIAGTHHMAEFQGLQPALQNLFSKKISPQKYLLEKEHGLYRNNLAQQLNEIHLTIYTSSKRKIKNLYRILINLIKFTLKKQRSL
jgi:hypothetical protein